MFKNRFVLQKLTLIFFFIAIFFGFLIDSTAQAPDDILKLIGGNDPRIWVGKITIQRIGSQNEYESRPGFNYTKTRQVNDTVIIHACGTAGNIQVSNATRTLTDTMKKNSSSKGGNILCPPPTKNKDGGDSTPSFGPGKSTIEKASRKFKLYKDKDSPSVKDTASVAINIIMGNRALISGNSSALVTEDSETYRKDIASCSGKTKEMTTYVFPGKYKDKVIIKKSGMSENDSVSYMTTILPPFPLPLAFAKEISISRDNNIIKDSMVVDEIIPRSPGLYKEKTTAQWEFKAKNPCIDIYIKMLQDLAYAEAFLNTAAQDAAIDITHYKKLVDKIYYEIYHNRKYPEKPKDGPDNRPKGVDEVFTDYKCKTHGLDDFKKQLADYCEPEVIYKATEAHENKHVTQCKNSNKNFTSDIPRNMGLNEVFAYIAGVKVYLAWLDTHCPKYKEEIQQDRSKAAHIKRIAAKMREI